jgi:hypothetical protein
VICEKINRQADLTVSSRSAATIPLKYSDTQIIHRLRTTIGLPADAITKSVLIASAGRPMVPHNP